MKEINKTKVTINRYLAFPIISLASFITLRLNSVGFIPDILSLADNINIANYLRGVISSMVSLTGFLIAILLIAFEYYKSNLNKTYLKYYLYNKHVSNLVLYYIFVFLFNTLSLLNLKGNQPVSVGEITTCYVSIISFVILIPLTFYLSFKIVKGLSINDIVDEHLEKLSFDKVFLINSKNKIIPTHTQFHQNENISQIVDNDTLAILQKLIVNLIKSEDLVKAQVVLNTISDKFTNFITTENPKTVLEQTQLHQYRYSSFLLSIVRESSLNAQLSSNLILGKVLELIEEFYFSFNSKNHYIRAISSLKESTYPKLIKLFRNDFEAKTDILESLRKVIDNIIKCNLPEEKYIMYLDPEYQKENNITLNENSKDYRDVDSRLSWDEFLNEYPQYLKDEIEVAIAEKSESKFLELLSILKKITFSFYWGIDNKEKNKHLKSRWMLNNFSSILELYKKAIEKNVIHKVSPYHIFGLDDIKERYNRNDLHPRSILVEYLRFILWLNKNKKLNYSIYSGIYSLGNHGTIFMGQNLTNLACFFANKYHHGEKYINGFEDVISTIEQIYQNHISHGVYNDLTLKVTLEIIKTAKRQYNSSRKNQSKSQKVLRKLNKIIKEIKKADNKV